MAAVRDFREMEAANAAAEAVELAQKHLVQPWPYAGSVGTEARSLMTVGRRHLPDRRRRQAADRRPGRHVVPQCRPPPRGTGARHVRPGDGAVLQHAVVHDERALGRAVAAHRGIRAGRPQPCLLHHRRIVGGGDGAALHAVLQQCARQAREEADPQPRRRLSRLDLSVGVAQRTAARPRLDGRGRRADRQAVLARSVPPAEGHDSRKRSATSWSTSSATR